MAPALRPLSEWWPWTGSIEFLSLLLELKRRVPQGRFLYYR